MELSMAVNNDQLPLVFTSSLEIIGTNYALRCDAKYADAVAIDIEKRVRGSGCFELCEFLPDSFVKGIQPTYLDQLTEDSIPVINTLSIQNLAINVEHCRHITPEDFELVNEDKRLRIGDVLLTVDGGVSIGKPVLFNLEGDFTVDSHVTILRPQGLTPLGLVYLLASPLGQKQFQRAESGASGQTTVTEDDIRRFIFPRSILADIDKIAAKLERERERIREKRMELNAQETKLWEQLNILG
jgi:hypothetical protein